jgi:hypothetical protein
MGIVMLFNTSPAERSSSMGSVLAIVLLEA